MNKLILVLFTIAVSLIGNAQTDIKDIFELDNFFSSSSNADTKADVYIKKLSDFDIDLSIPTDFIPLDMRGRSSVIKYFFPTANAIVPNPIGFESPDNKALFLYPFIFNKSGTGLLRNGEYIENELRANAKDINLDVRPLINIIAQDDMSLYANADTVVIYEMDLVLNNYYFGGYNNCIGIYLRKFGHPSLLSKIILTDEAFKEKEKYIRLFFENINYGENPKQELIEAEKQLPTGTELNFPTKPRVCGGITVEGIDDKTLYELNIIKQWCIEHGRLPQINNELREVLNNAIKK